MDSCSALIAINLRSRKYRKSGPPHANEMLKLTIKAIHQPLTCSFLPSVTIQILKADAAIKRSLFKEREAALILAS